MENDITTVAAVPAVAYPMTSYKDVKRTCSPLLQRFVCFESDKLSASEHRHV